MSFLTKALSKIGIGAAKIDAVLDNVNVCPGDTIRGVINIQGGKVAQEINKIDLDIYSNYYAEERQGEEIKTVERHARIDGIKIQHSFAIEPGETRQIPFEFQLSYYAPLTIGRSYLWLTTNLDIDCALDKADKDFINVEATPLQAAIFTAMDNMGFSLVEAENEQCNRTFSNLPFIQEFEFKAQRGQFRHQLDEVEIVMFCDAEQIQLFLEIDRRANGVSGMFAEMFDTDESHVKLVLTQNDIDDVEQILLDVIQQH